MNLTTMTRDSDSDSMSGAFGCPAGAAGLAGALGLAGAAFPSAAFPPAAPAAGAALNVSSSGSAPPTYLFELLGAASASSCSLMPKKFANSPGSISPDPSSSISSKMASISAFVHLMPSSGIVFANSVFWIMPFPSSSMSLNICAIVSAFLFSVALRTPTAAAVCCRVRGACEGSSPAAGASGGLAGRVGASGSYGPAGGLGGGVAAAAASFARLTLRAAAFFVFLMAQIWAMKRRGFVRTR